MGILEKLIWVFLNLVCIGIDIMVFYVIVKMVLNRWTVNWLIPFDVAGKGLVNFYVDFIEKRWRKVNSTVLTPQNCLFMGLAILIIARLLIMALAGIL